MTGKLVKWNDQRGFGFVRPEGEAIIVEAFVHISDIQECGRRPTNGDRLRFTIKAGTDGRVRVSQAQILGAVGMSRSQISSKSSCRMASRRQNSLLQRIGMVALIGGFLALGVQFCSGYFPGIIESTSKPGCLVKGNVSFDSGRKVYHVVGMEDYEITKISPEKGEQWFCTEQEAVSAGWIRAPR
ncbi:cold-shock protein [Cyanobium sp. ULC082]